MCEANAYLMKGDDASLVMEAVDVVEPGDDGLRTKDIMSEGMTEVGTKLDLARAYVDMGDPAGARSILEEVLDEGDSDPTRPTSRFKRRVASVGQTPGQDQHYRCRCGTQQRGQRNPDRDPRQ